MDQQEIELLITALNPLQYNPHANLTHHQFKKLDLTLATKWFVEYQRTTFSCPDCQEEVIRLAHERAPLVVCQGCRSIIKVTEDDRKIHKLDFKRFLRHLQSRCEIKAQELQDFKGLNLLGIDDWNQDKWQVIFCFSKRMIESFGTLLEAQLSWKSDFTLILVDEVPDFEPHYLMALENLWVFIERWFEASGDTIEQVYTESIEKIKLRIGLLDVDVDATILLSALRKSATSTSADGDSFEEEVFRVCSWLFDTVLPFGSSYKGFSIPDGLITDYTVSDRQPLLFYDCKSFKGPKFKKEANSKTAMQASYYQRFLSDFSRKVLM